MPKVTKRRHSGATCFINVVTCLHAFIQGEGGKATDQIEGIIRGIGRYYETGDACTCDKDEFDQIRYKIILAILVIATSSDDPMTHLFITQQLQDSNCSKKGSIDAFINIYAFLNLIESLMQPQQKLRIQSCSHEFFFGLIFQESSQSGPDLPDL